MVSPKQVLPQRKAHGQDLGGKEACVTFFFIRTTKMSTMHKESGGDEYKLKGSWKHTKRD